MEIKAFEKKVGRSIYHHFYGFLCKENIDNQFKLKLLKSGKTVRTNIISVYVERFKELNLPIEDLVREAFDWTNSMWDEINEKWINEVKGLL